MRKAILAGEMSRYRLAKVAGVSEAALSLFVNHHRTLTLTSAAKVAKALGLALRTIDER